MKGKWMERFKGCNARTLRRDLLSGLIVGIIAIPLGMAFAIASGVNPQYGIYTTIIAGFLISLFGGSRFQIGGPTGAFVPVLLLIVMQYGFENLLIAGFMAGIMLVLMGLLKLGALIRYIPRPVTLGFTAGIAVIIFTGQIGSFLGLSGLTKHEDFVSNMKEIYEHLGTADLYSLVTAFVCLASVIICSRYAPKIPGSLVGLTAATFVAVFFFPGQVATIGSTYGEISSTLPAFTIPDFSLERIQQLLYPAFIIAMLGGIESLLSAVVADGMTGKRHDSNQELIGQGIANIVTPLFGGIPATGAIARTATNIKSGAVTPFSGIIHSIVVLLVLLLFAPLASHIPLAGMAPILMVVAWNMSERKEFVRGLKTKTTDSILMAVTFLLTVLTNLTIAVEVGLVMAAVLFVKRMSDIATVAKVLPDPASKHEKVVPHMVNENHDCPQVRIFTVEGPLFFGAAAQFEQLILNAADDRHRILLLRMGKVPLLDMTGEANLAAVVHDYKKRGGSVLISGIQQQPRRMLELTGLAAEIGHDHFFEHTGEAIDAALARVETPKCAGCKHFAFRECSVLSKTDSPKQMMYSM